MGVPVGFSKIYTGQLVGIRLLTVDIYQRDTISPLPTLSTVTFEQELVWKFGSLLGGTVEKGLMPGSSVIKVEDPGSTIFLHLSTARTSGATDMDFYVVISGGSIQIEARPRIKNIDTLASDTIATPLLTLQLYDGIATLDRVQTLALSQSLRGAFQDALYTTLLPIPQIDFRLDFLPTNVNPAVDGAKYYLDVRSERVDGEMEQQRAYQDRITLCYELLLMRLWQGLNGSWHASQPHLMGMAGTVLRDPVLGLITEEAVTSSAVQLTQQDFEGGLRRRLHDPITRVEIKRTFRGTPRPFATTELLYALNMIREGGFVHATRALDNWPAISGASSGLIDPRGRANNGLQLEESQGNEQYGMWIAADETVQWIFDGYFALEKNGLGGNPSRSAYVELLWEAWNPIADVNYWVDASGNFTTVRTILATPTQTLDNNGAGTLTWYNFWITIRDQAPNDGRLVVRLLGSNADGAPGGTGYFIHWDDLLLHPVNPDADDGAGKPARLEQVTLKTALWQYDAAGNPVPGEVVKLSHEVPHISYVLESTGAPVGSFTAELGEFSLFDTTEAPSRFTMAAISYGGTDYWDPVEAVYALLIDLLSMPHWGLSGEVNSVLPPETPVLHPDGTAYFMVSGTVDLITGITRGEWIENKLAP